VERVPTARRTTTEEETRARYWMALLKTKGGAAAHSSKVS